MDIGLLLTIIGTIATVVFGVLGIYLVFIRIDRPRIDIVDESTINLYDSIVKNITDVKVTFKEEAVIENLLLYRFFIVNPGRTDITKGMIEQPLTLELKSGNFWKSARQIASSDNLSFTIEINDENMVVRNKLFRPNEFFYIEAIIEGSEANTNKLVVVKHRIENLQSVRQFKIEELRSYDKILLPLFVLVVMTVLMLFVYNPYTLESDDIDVSSQQFTIPPDQAALIDSLNKRITRVEDDIDRYYGIQLSIYSDSNSTLTPSTTVTELRTMLIKSADSISSVYGLRHLGEVEEYYKKMQQERQALINNNVVDRDDKNLFAEDVDWYKHQAAEEYPSVELLAKGRTKMYYINDYYGVTFELKSYIWPAFFFYAFVLLYLYAIYKMILEIYRYREYGKLRGKLTDAISSRKSN